MSSLLSAVLYDSKALKEIVQPYHVVYFANHLALARCRGEHDDVVLAERPGCSACVRTPSTTTAPHTCSSWISFLTSVEIARIIDCCDIGQLDGPFINDSFRRVIYRGAQPIPLVAFSTAGSVLLVLCAISSWSTGSGGGNSGSPFAFAHGATITVIWV